MEKIFNSYTIVNLRDIATKAGLKGHRRFVKKDLVEFMLKNKSKFSDLKEAVKKPRKNAKVVQITAAPKLPKKKKIIKPKEKPKTPPKPIAKSPPKPLKPSERYRLQQMGFRPKERAEGQQSTRFREKDFQFAVLGMSLKQFVKDSESDKKKYYDILLERLVSFFSPDIEGKGFKEKNIEPIEEYIYNYAFYEKGKYEWEERNADPNVPWYERKSYEVDYDTIRDRNKDLKDPDTTKEYKSFLRHLIKGGEKLRKKDEDFNRGKGKQEYIKEEKLRIKDLTKEFEPIVRKIIYDKTIKTMKGITDALGGAQYKPTAQGYVYQNSLGAQFRGYVRNNPAFKWDKEQYKPQKQYEGRGWA